MAQVKKWLTGFLAFVLLGLPAFYLRYDLRAYSVLTRFSEPNASGPLLRWETQPIAVTEVAVATSGSKIPARLYFPQAVRHPSGIVLVHGIHLLAIDDPRFINLARALSGAGFAVLTPLLASLADYHVEAGSIDKIGDSVHWLEARSGTGPVTVLGISFGGGLSLLTAVQPQYEHDIRAIGLIGGYEDLARVSRFLATSEEEFPDGRVVHLAAHDYGAAVFVYDHLGQFFSLIDLAPAREALRFYLWEQPAGAKPWLPKLSPAGRAKMDALFARRIDLLRPELLSAIQADQKELGALSPHGKIGDLRIPVFILHGSGDTVIPPAESLWLAREVPRGDLRAVLITPVFSHVDMKGKVSLWEELRLVHFMAGVLRAADSN
ncbi:MAG: alpha/beta fold hydrolase [Candidatus Acidiferrales bacterium]